MLRQQYVPAFNELDHLLRTSNGLFSKHALQSDQETKAGWYSRLLSTLAIAVEGDTIELAAARMADHGSSAIVTVFTTKRVIVGTIEDVESKDSNTAVDTVPRTALQSLRVRASEPYNREGSLAHAWPGTIEFAAGYAGLDFSVFVAGPAVSEDDYKKKSKLFEFLEQLQSELTASS